MIMKIYTKTGDQGKTRLVDGSCVEKFNPRVEAYGCVDELNSTIGVVRSQILLEKSLSLLILNPLLEQIQCDLFSIGSLLATAERSVFDKLPQIEEKDILRLEKWIDTSTEELPVLKNFILPGGTLCASLMHVSRTSCRRAERRCSEIHNSEQQYQSVLIYLNRLSDLLFTWARWINLKSNQTETVWKKNHDL